MVKKKGKSVSFDAMVKFFMHNYDIPTKKDVDRLMAKLDHLETLLRAAVPNHQKRGGAKKGDLDMAGVPTTAIDIVYAVIKRFKEDVGVDEIQARTGYDKKKIRNIIFRLHKAGKIVRRRRGRYTAS